MTDDAYQPLGDRVVIRPTEEAAAQSPGGIYIPDTAQEKPQEGVVLAVGPGRTTDAGTLLPVSVKVGDTVIYPQFVGTEFRQGGEDLLIMSEDDILVVK